MPAYQRYAIFYTPPPGAFADFGARWLGWDLRNGSFAQQYDVPNLAHATKVAQRYGFHGTLKAPFHLATGASACDLLRATSSLASRYCAFDVSLQLAPLGRLLSLRPATQSQQLNDLADACVTSLDRFRAPLSQKDMARRNTHRLSNVQREYLMDWGYPHVLQEFRFHMTLSRPVDDDTAAELCAAAQNRLLQAALNLHFDRITVVGEREDGRFEALEDLMLAAKHGDSSY